MSRDPLGPSDTEPGPIESSGGGGGGAPETAQYVVLATNGTLTQERVLTAGSGISITDGGAGSTVTIAATGGGGGLSQAEVLARVSLGV